MTHAAQKINATAARQRACRRVLSYHYHDDSVWGQDFKTTIPSMISLDEANASPRGDGITIAIYDFGQMQ